MGSDSPIKVLIDGVCEAIDRLEGSAKAILIGTPEVLHFLPEDLKSVEFLEADTVITMEDSPLYSVRRKQNSSMMTALRLLREQRADAVVTTGNTGALIAGASISLPHIEGIERPALLALLPTKKNPVAVIDAGGNVSSASKHLVQYALMGAAYQKYSNGIEHPRVGLLNIGIESIKGTDELRQAYQYLSEHKNPHMDFIGNIEGREVFQGNVDVLITDGFSGNVFLKTSEGVSLFLLETIKKQFSQFPQFHETLSELQAKFDYSEYPGALLCGIEGVVIKCHGNSSAAAISQSILSAASLAKAQFAGKIHEMLS